VAAVDELARAARYQSNAILVRLDFLRHADAHETSLPGVVSLGWPEPITRRMRAKSHADQPHACQGCARNFPIDPMQAAATIAPPCAVGHSSPLSCGALHRSRRALTL